MDMGDVESGIDSDFELSLIWTMITYLKNLINKTYVY